MIHLKRKNFLVFAQNELRSWPPPCQLIPFGPGRLRGCVASLSSPCRASWLLHCLLLSSHCAALLSTHCARHASLLLRLIALPSHRLVAPAGCHIASRRPLVAPPSCQLVAPACCRITSPHPLVAPHTTLSFSRCVSWLLHCLLMCRPLVVSLSHCATSHCLIDPAGCCVIIFHRPLILPPSRPLIMLTGCCIACPCAARLSSRRGPLPTPSNAVKCCCRH